MTGAVEKKLKMKKKNRKRYAFAIHIIICSLVFSACSKHTKSPRDVREQYFAEENQVKNYADGEISTFGLNIAPANTGSGNTENEQIWLLHFAAYPFGAWPFEVELYWDGHEVLCDRIVVSE